MTTEYPHACLFPSETLGKRLAVVVPYRDRAQHLEKFLPHLKAYFERDKVDRHLRMSLHIVEQLGDAPFNRGLLLNAGVRLSWDSADYFCFHDVDYLPIWADYSFPEWPTRAIWHGLRLREDKESFFGGVVLLSKAHLDVTNGYPNSYWGWGYEDTELLARCRAQNLAIGHRDGTFTGLPHQHEGLDMGGRRKPEVIRNAEQFQRRLATIREVMQIDGFRQAAFSLESHALLKVAGEPVPHFHHHGVRIAG
ncbi:MAG: galactosyltransferase [Rhodocyclaceae bacterium]|nr:galactosyltransferase [Rhodocyclaceae bacterium]